MNKLIIAVVGGTGAQGGGVVDALLAAGTYSVRVATRNPAGESAKALTQRGVEVRKADLLDPGSLRALFEGAYGAFVVTNFWDPAQMHRETEIGSAAAKVARTAGVQHYIWSTLPDYENLSGGRVKVAHFSDKARVDAAVEAAGFARHTFVQAPMYFQNFIGMNVPQSLPNGGRGWAVPMAPAARVMHAGDATEVGRVVQPAFAAGDKLPNGSYLAVCGGLYSWNDFVGTLNAQGHNLKVLQVPPEAYDDFYPGAREMREMYQFYEQYTYFGPQGEKRVAAAKALCPGGWTSFGEWARIHMKAG